MVADSIILVFKTSKRLFISIISFIDLCPNVCGFSDKEDRVHVINHVSYVL